MQASKPQYSEAAAKAFAPKVPSAWRNQAKLPAALERQVFPDAREMQWHPGDLQDPVGDLNAAAAPGVLHKYQGRVLLIATGACAIHCRYCFRRHFPYGQELAARDGWQAALDYIGNDHSITEVILSGGDPLMLSQRRLTQLSDGLAQLPHVKRLRIHSRVPTVEPNRIDTALCQWLQALPQTTIVVLHVNHPDELLPAGLKAIERLKCTGSALFNQAVLLRNINDKAIILEKLSEVLFANGVLPYYLHLLDRVAGAAHFEVPEAEAIKIHQQLQRALPGYLVPKLVTERAGEPNKTPINV